MMPLSSPDRSFIEAAVILVTHIDSFIMLASHLKQTKTVIRDVMLFHRIQK